MVDKDQTSKQVVAELVSRLRSLKGKTPDRQVVKTPLVELGVELDPKHPTSLRLLSGVRRVWSVLWGTTGKGLRRVQVSDMGALLTEPTGQDGLIAQVHVDTLAGSTPVGRGFAKPVERVQLTSQSGLLVAEFSNDALAYFGQVVARPTTNKADNGGTQIDVFVHCKVIRFWDFNGASTDDVRVIGYYR